jgi:hypothetical protein
MSDRLLHKRVLELSDGEREGRDRVARLERLERRDLTEELEWLELSGREVRLQQRYDGMWRDMVSVLLIVESRNRATIRIEEQDEWQKFPLQERSAREKQRFRRDFDLMLQEMEATIAVLEQKRRTRMVVTEEKEWSALMNAFAGRPKRSTIAPQKVTKVTITRGPKAKAAPVGVRRTIAVGGLVHGMAEAFGVVASEPNGHPRVLRGPSPGPGASPPRRVSASPSASSPAVSPIRWVAPASARSASPVPSQPLLAGSPVRSLTHSHSSPSMRSAGVPKPPPKPASTLTRKPSVQVIEAIARITAERRREEPGGARESFDHDPLTREVGPCPVQVRR